MNTFEITYKPYSDSAILLEWPQLISKEILLDLKRFVTNIEQEKLNYILDLNYVYSSLLIIYEKDKINYETLKKKLKELYVSLHTEVKIKINCWEIPVCYDLSYGLDLPELSQVLNLPINEIIKLHSKSKYTVYGYGFLPGFLYLGGLSNKLHFPRKKTPRLNVFEGAVAIGGAQTGIYPQNSPGGWNIIGKIPINLFNSANENQLCEILPGDEIMFKPILLNEFNAISKNYKLKKINND